MFLSPVPSPNVQGILVAKVKKTSYIVIMHDLFFDGNRFRHIVAERVRIVDGVD